MTSEEHVLLIVAATFSFSTWILAFIILWAGGRR